MQRIYIKNIKKIFIVVIYEIVSKHNILIFFLFIFDHGLLSQKY